MRLIDADELIPSLKMGEVSADTAYGDGRNGGIYFAIWRIGQMPTIDAVPVVRCKDCKYRYYDKHYGFGWMCDLDSADAYDSTRGVDDGEWFCADGERRNDGKENAD